MAKSVTVFDLSLSQDGRSVMKTITRFLSRDYINILICPATLPVPLFLDIVKEGGSIDGGFVYFIPSQSTISAGSKRISIPERSKYTISTDKIFTDEGKELEVLYVVRNNHEIIKQPPSPSTPEDDWSISIREKISSIITQSQITLFINDKNIIDRIVEDPSWKAVFTHISFNPDPRNNYETMETLGDKVMSLVFVNSLVSGGDDDRIRRRVDPNLITDIHKEILSRSKQNEMGQHVGFNNLIRSTIQVDESIVEDVVEAFFGNLFSVANRVSENRDGFLVCQSVFNFIFKNTFPDLNIFEIKKDPQTILDQIFQKLGWEHPEFEYNKSSMVSTIRLSQDAVQSISSINGKDTIPSGNIIACSEGSNKKDAERKASLIAVEFLKKTWGIDQKYIRRVVKQKLMADPRYQTAYSQALKKVESLGFSDIYVQRKSKHRVQYYIVTAIAIDDLETPLFTYRSEDGGGNVDGHIHALLAYSDQTENNI